MDSMQAAPFAREPVSILTVTTLFPNDVQPSHGIFVETRLRKLVASGMVDAHVLAPVPWLPPLISYGAVGPLWKVPRHSARGGIAVEHPRYLVVPKIGMNIAPFTLYRAMHSQLKKLLASGIKVDLIDAHYFYPDGVAAVWLARAFDLPVVVTARGTDISLIPQFAFARKLIVEAARHADGVIAVCQALKDELVALGVPADRVSVLRNGVDLELFQPRDRLALRKAMAVDGFTLVSVGHLIERKGHHHAIEALTGLPDATLLIAGDGPERSALEALAARIGVAGRVRFLGVLAQSALCDVYNCADALVLASSREGWANVLLEAMACGTPVIASAVWGTPEVVASPDAGRLMPSLDANGVVEAATALRGALPERAATRKYAEGFDWQSTTDGQIRLFREILARRAAAQPKIPA